MFQPVEQKHNSSVISSWSEYTRNTLQCFYSTYLQIISKYVLSTDFYSKCANFTTVQKHATIAYKKVTKLPLLQTSTAVLLQ